MWHLGDFLLESLLYSTWVCSHCLSVSCILHPLTLPDFQYFTFTWLVYGIKSLEIFKSPRRPITQFLYRTYKVYFRQAKREKFENVYLTQVCFRDETPPLPLEFMIDLNKSVCACVSMCVLG